MSNTENLYKSKRLIDITQSTVLTFQLKYDSKCKYGIGIASQTKNNNDTFINSIQRGFIIQSFKKGYNTFTYDLTFNQQSNRFYLNGETVIIVFQQGTAAESNDYQSVDVENEKYNIYYNINTNEIKTNNGQFLYFATKSNFDENTISVDDREYYKRNNYHINTYVLSDYLKSGDEFLLDISSQGDALTFIQLSKDVTKEIQGVPHDSIKLYKNGELSSELSTLDEIIYKQPYKTRIVISDYARTMSISIYDYEQEMFKIKQIFHFGDRIKQDDYKLLFLIQPDEKLEIENLTSNF